MISNRYYPDAQTLCDALRRSPDDDHGKIYIDALERYGFQCHPAAQSVLMQYGGLSLPIKSPLDNTKTVFNMLIDPRIFLGELLPEEAAHYSAKVMRHLCPIGEERIDTSDIYCDSDGAIWFARDDLIYPGGKDIIQTVANEIQRIAQTYD